MPDGPAKQRSSAAVRALAQTVQAEETALQKGATGAKQPLTETQISDRQKVLQTARMIAKMPAGSAKEAAIRRIKKTALDMSRNRDGFVNQEKADESMEKLHNTENEIRQVAQVTKQKPLL